MTNTYLSREDAPITPAAWEILDQTMLVTAKNYLSGRRILNIEGPYGLGLKAVSLKDPVVESAPITSPLLPLAYIIKSFTISMPHNWLSNSRQHKEKSQKNSCEQQ